MEKNQSCNLCLPAYNKFLFGMLYINLLNLVWFWSRIWGFYKFWNFKSWGFWYLLLSSLILILYLKCFLFRFMWFFVFLLKAMIFGWLIICLDSTQKIMELDIIIWYCSMFWIVYIVITTRKSYCYSNLKLGVSSLYHGLCLYICSLY